MSSVTALVYLYNNDINTYELVLRLTIIDVGIESKSAVLYVEGEGVDIEVAGAHNLDR